MVGFLVKHQGYVLAAISASAALVVGAFSWLLTYNTQLVEDQHRQEDVTKALAATAESIKSTETSIQRTNGRVEEVDRSLRSDQSKIKTTLRKQTTFILEQADDQRMLLEKLLRSSKVSVPPEPATLKAARQDLQTLTDEL
jgi:septal ring factor EnvC (AmiA/AmiB activator)